MNNEYSTWHVWVEIDGLILDASAAINCKFHNIKVGSQLSETPLYKRCDLDTREEIKINKQNEMLFELYHDSPEKNWHLFRLEDKEQYNVLVSIYNTLSKNDLKQFARGKKVKMVCVLVKTIRHRIHGVNEFMILLNTFNFIV